MQGLAVRVAKGLNRLRGRKGTVFADRYHVRLIRSPRQARNVLAYVLNNSLRHEREHGYLYLPEALARFSSAAWFDGWRDVPDTQLRALRKGDDPPLTHSMTWLMTEGWRRHGLVRSTEVPGA